MSSAHGDAETQAQASVPRNPVIIPETDHPIRLHSLDKEALKVLYRLRDAGFSGYLVGGGVRDLYMGKQPKDFDISTDARPGQLRKLFRNSRTIGRRFRLVQVFFRGGKIIEVSTLRSQNEHDIDGPEKVLPSNNTFGTLPEDALRRDLTINSLFYEIENRTIIDYVDGVEDLDRHVIRIVGDPDRRVVRDPVRIMRAIRHAARTGYSIEPLTWKAIVAHRDKLMLCPPSRIRDELLKDLRSGASRPWMQLAIESGLFYTLFPAYTELLEGEGGGVRRRLLYDLLAAVDRLVGLGDDERRIEIPDYMILTLLVTPFIDARFDLLAQHQKGAAHYHFTRDVRSAIDEMYGEQFNLKRMAKESMATMLANLGTFERFGKRNDWPRWLRKKSYFKDCFRFYRLFQEATGGRPADAKMFAVDIPADRDVEIPDQGNGGRTFGANSRGRGRKGSRPAFTNRKRGVFGLRKR